MQIETHSFIVRVWSEKKDSQGKTLTWRGSIEHVGQKERHYFSAWEELTRFIEDRAEIGPDRRLPPQFNLRLT